MPKLKEKGKLTPQDNAAVSEVDITSNMATTRSSARIQSQSGLRLHPLQNVRQSVSRTSPKSIGVTLTNLIKSPFKKKPQTLNVKEPSPSFENLDSKHADDESGELSPPPPPCLPPPILAIETQDKNSQAIVEAINSLQITMIETHLSLERKMDLKLSSVEDQLQMLNHKLRDQDKAISDLRSNMVDTSSLKQIEESLTSVAAQADQKFVDIEQEFVSLRTELNAYHTENMRLNHRIFEAEEKLSLQAIRSKKYNFTLEGVPEAQDQNQGEDLKSTLVEKINEGSKAQISKDDFTSAYRQGAFVLNAVKPRPVQIVVKDDGARNLILRSRGKLAKSAIWINEDLPAPYRRRKTMLRDLVKTAKGKKHQAKINQGGISIDGRTYGPEQFSQLPDGMRPHDASTRVTANQGLAFASQWTPLSNMATAYFLYEGVLFNSSEQCFQFTKATHENNDELANDILVLSDAYECKRLSNEKGGKDLSEEWMQKREGIMADIIRAKFTQNDDMLETLINTGTSNLYEATTDHFWGNGSTLFSKTTQQEAGKGQNKLGLLLMALRNDLSEGMAIALPSEGNAFTDTSTGTASPTTHTSSQTAAT